jgi:hypothetical protein
MPIATSTAIAMAAMAAAQAGSSAYAAHKSGEAGKLPPDQQAMQNQALQVQNQRMLMQNPLFEQLTQGAMSRQPRSAMPASYQLPNLLQPGQGGQAVPRGQNTNAALSQLGRRMRPPQSYS